MVNLLVMSSKSTCLNYRNCRKIRCVDYYKCYSWKFSAIDKPLFIYRYKKTQPQVITMIWESICNRWYAVFWWRPSFWAHHFKRNCKSCCLPVNDPGTAIQIISSYVRLFSLWAEPLDSKRREKNHTTALRFQNLQLESIWDAFRPLARDGAGNIEVMIRLQSL
jgi:hypothetical protein